MSTTAMVLALLALVGGSLLALGWRERLLFAVPYLATLNRLAVPIGASAIRLDQLAACLLCIPVFVGVLTRRRHLHSTSGTRWLLAIVIVNVLASVVNSPVPQYSLSQCLNLASALVLYPLLVNMLQTERELSRFMLHVLRAGVVACAVGAGAYILAVSGMPVGGAETNRAATETFVRAYGAYGTMVEPNILGGFAAAHFAMGLLLWTRLPRQHEARNTARVLTVVAAVALVLSFTRSAWLGALGATVVIALMQTRSRGQRARQVMRPLAIVLVVATVGILLPGEAGAFLRFKLANLVNFTSPTALVRLVMYRMAWSQTAAHPVIGYGTFSFAALASEASDFTRYEGWHNLWIGNYLLLALHDTGIIGLVLWTIMLGGIWTAAWRVVRRPRMASTELRTRTLALLIAYSILLIAFLATSGFTLGYPWLLIGLLAAHIERAAAEHDELNQAAIQDPVAPPP